MSPFNNQHQSAGHGVREQSLWPRGAFRCCRPGQRPDRNFMRLKPEPPSYGAPRFLTPETIGEKVFI